jgi:hypothetical protein
MVNTFKTPTVMSEEEFIEKYDGTVCSDWNKIDEHGESFKGAWEAEENTFEKEHASQITRRRNGEALYKLPYPHTAIFYTIGIGCSNRLESVRYSNFLCEWTFRKMSQMGIVY